MLYSVKQAYEYLNRSIGINQLRDLMRRNVIRSTWVNGRLITTRDELDNFCKSLINKSILNISKKFGDNNGSQVKTTISDARIQCNET